MKVVRVLVAAFLVGACWAAWAEGPVPAQAPAVQDAPKEAPTKPGEYKFKFVARVDGKPVQMTYALVLPTGYDTNAQQKFPMIVFMHGAGEVGTDGEAVFQHGPGAELRYHKGFKDYFPFIVLCPQCPPRGERWDQPQMYKAVSLIVDAAIKSVRADPDRVYLTGLSMGGKGCWLAAMEGGDRFAAIAPMCSGFTTPPDAAQKLKYVAVWMIAGAQDGESVNHDNEMVGVLKGNLAEVRNTIVPGADHGVWPAFYASDQFYEWMLSHKRPNAQERRAMEASGPYLNRKQELPRTAGHHRVVVPVQINGQGTPMVCSVFVPKGYSPTGTKRAPMLVFLHELHTIGVPWKDVVLHGPEALMEEKGNEGLRDGFPFVVVSPMLPAAVGDWKTPDIAKGVLKCVDELSKEMNVDKGRIYATGLNEGGMGVWQLAMADPGRFAAMAPVIAKGAFAPPGNAGEVLKNVANWTFVPQSEQGTLDAVKNAFKAWKAETKLTPVGAKTVAEQNGAFASKELYEWLLKQGK